LFPKEYAKHDMSVNVIPVAEFDVEEEEEEELSSQAVITY